MFKFKVQYCKRRMVAYINGELPHGARRRVARYIDECDECYAEYLRQRGVQRELESGAQMVGRPSEAQLNRIWLAVQHDLETPARTQQTPSFYLGMLTMILLIVLILPLFVDEHRVAQTAATQPTPHNISPAARATEAPGHVLVMNVDSVRFVLTGQTQAAIMPEAAPQRTPNASR
jgi:anti-sigma factor RsiW